MYLTATSSIKRKFCPHDYFREEQHCGRDLLLCRKCGNVEEVPE